MQQQNQNNNDDTVNDKSFIRHDSLNSDTHFNGLSQEEMDEIEQHVRKYIGPFDRVLHELISDRLHLDIIIVPPNDKVPFNTLITMGASEFEMKVPPELKKNFSYAEYVMYLPANWKLDEASLRENKWYWPIRMLKTIAKIPRTFDSWLFYGHTIPNFDPPQVFDESTKQKGSLVTYPYYADQKEFIFLKGAKKTVVFWGVTSIYEGEWEIKLAKGADYLEELASKQKIEHAWINPTRQEIKDIG